MKVNKEIENAWGVDEDDIDLSEEEVEESDDLVKRIC